MVKKIFCFTAVLLLTANTAIAQKIAYVWGLTDGKEEFNDALGEQEKTQAWFDQTFVNTELGATGDGKFLNPAQITSNEDGCMDDVSVMWINIDIPHKSYDENTALLEDLDFILSVQDFVQRGGTLFLTKEAVPMAHLIGRMCEPTEKGHGGFAFTDGALKLWVINANMGGVYDRTSHPIYNNISTDLTDGEGKAGYALMKTTTWTTEINTGWNDLYPKAEGITLDYTTEGVRANDDPEKLADFEESWNCQVLGTWGHIEDYFGAFIVEFLPGMFNGEEWKGTVITCGPAAYQWVNENEYMDNVKTLSANALNYLKSKAALQPTSINIMHNDPSSLISHHSSIYDLQGRKVADNLSSLISHPSSKPGIYIIGGKKFIK